MAEPKKTKVRPRAGLSEQLRDAIGREPGSLHALARAADVPGPVVARFVAGTRGLTLESADRIAGALGLRLIQSRRRNKKG